MFIYTPISHKVIRSTVIFCSKVKILNTINIIFSILLVILILFMYYILLKYFFFFNLHTTGIMCQDLNNNLDIDLVVDKPLEITEVEFEGFFPSDESISDLVIPFIVVWIGT